MHSRICTGRATRWALPRFLVQQELPSTNGTEINETVFGGKLVRAKNNGGIKYSKTAVI